MKNQDSRALKDVPLVFEGVWVEKLIDCAAEARSRRQHKASSSSDVEHLFRKLVSDKTVKVPQGFNASCLMEGVLDAVRVFAGEPTRRQMRRDIDELRRLASAAIEADNHAAEGHRNDRRYVDEAYDRLAQFLSTVSPRVRDYLDKSMVGWRWFAQPEPQDNPKERKRIPFHVQRRAQSLPLPGALRDPALRRQACIDVWTICTRGVVVVPAGRVLPSGSRSRLRLRYFCNAPPPRRMDRGSERILVFSMHRAWLNAWPNGGRQPSWTARHDTERPHPFVKLADGVLQLVGEPLASAVSLLNELHEVRKSSASWQFDEKKENLKRCILRTIRQTGAKTQTDISRLVSHPPKGLIAVALSELQAEGMIRFTEAKKTGGRPRRIWSAVSE